MKNRRLSVISKTFQSHLSGSMCGFRIGLEQNRIHRRFRFEPASPGLSGLGPSNLPARETRIRIVGHVLRFEGSDAHTPPPKPSADCRRHPTFPGVRRRPAYEDWPHSLEALSDQPNKIWTADERHHRTCRQLCWRQHNAADRVTHGKENASEQ